MRSKRFAACVCLPFAKQRSTRPSSRGLTRQREKFRRPVSAAEVPDRKKRQVRLPADVERQADLEWSEIEPDAAGG